ncbi:hypothetical protein OSB04_008868 [Centaurea solstitialis]|uniref:Peroxidase n=1 Tax=Centaurea solstitialis TaxID=347529 RepID=A0AA38U748_9ASTR|nr:hypothetical protein OSB04_008868 [Centaurea solstitialis]
MRRLGCPKNGGDANQGQLDWQTPRTFDNIYYKNLIQKKGLLESDQVLFSAGGFTAGIVYEYSNNASKFNADFAAAMVKMGDLKPLVGDKVTNNYTPCKAQLSPTFYNVKCPNVLQIIKNSTRTAISSNPRMAAGLLRLHFHDCFVQGCDASIFLKDDPFKGIISERTALPNIFSVVGFDVIEAAKSKVEKECPGVVSCADILMVAVRDAVEMVGGPSWSVKLGRRDSTTANRRLAEKILPAAKAPLDSIIKVFNDSGLSVRDLVALSGAHTIGQVQCFLFRDRIYNDKSDIDPGFAKTRRRDCPITHGHTRRAPLDLVTPQLFDNNYFKNLIQRKGLLESDQVLFSAGGSTASIVSEYSSIPSKFMSDFAAAMVKLSDLGTLVGEKGVIRRVCSQLP